MKRWRVWLGAGAVIFVVGAAFLTIGLISYSQKNGDSDVGASADPSLQSFSGVSTHLPGEDGPGPVAGRSFHISPRVVTHRMIIESIGVNAPVIALGMDDENVPYVPDNEDDIAWYDFTVKPGGGSNAVFGGHLNWGGNPGVFFDLEDVQPGELVRILAEDGEEFTYRVFNNESLDPKNRDSVNVMAPADTDIITLITCGGTWVPDPDDERLGGSYTERVVVQAERVDNPRRFRGGFGF